MDGWGIVSCVDQFTRILRPFYEPTSKVEREQVGPS